MTKLTAKTRNEVETLLNSYSELCSVESKIGKRGMFFGVTVSNENDDSEFASVSIDDNLAKEAVQRQKVNVARQLSKFGIQV